PASSGRSPVVSSIRFACCGSNSANAEPTVPWPSSPTRNGASPEVTRRQVLVGLSAHHQAGRSRLAEDDGRAGDAVVVVGEREAVGPGGRSGDYVAGTRLGKQHVSY